MQRILFNGTTAGTFRLTFGNTSLLSNQITFSTNPTTMTNNLQAGLDSIFGAGNTKCGRAARRGGHDGQRISHLVRPRPVEREHSSAWPVNGTTAIPPADSAIVQTVFDGLANTVQTLSLNAGTDTPGDSDYALAQRRHFDGTSTDVLPGRQHDSRQPDCRPGAEVSEWHSWSDRQCGGHRSSGRTVHDCVWQRPEFTGCAGAGRDGKPAAARNEIQQLNFTGTTITGGSFRLTFTGNTFPVVPNFISYNDPVTNTLTLSAWPREFKPPSTFNSASAIRWCRPPTRRR